MPRRNQQTAAPVEQPTEEAREMQRQAPPAPVEEHATQPETAQTAGQQGETTAPTVEPGRRELTMRVTIKEGDPERDILATADVDIDGICTLRNVRIKNGDYGPRVTLPMTQMPVTGRWRDVAYFPSQEIRVQFDNVVMGAYRQALDMTQNTATEQAEAQSEPEYADMSM